MRKTENARKALPDRNSIETAVRSFCLDHDEIDFVLLFGSFHNGSPHRMSDIDLALHVSGDMPLIRQGMFVSELEERLHLTVDLCILNGLFRKDPGFAFAVIKESVPLFVRDREAFIIFKKNVFLYYMDTERLRKANLDGVKYRIKNRILGVSDAGKNHQA